MRAEGGRVTVEARTRKDDLAVAACAAIAHAVDAGEPRQPMLKTIVLPRTPSSLGNDFFADGYRWHRIS